MTPETLAVCTGARMDRAVKYAAFITATMEEFEIDTPTRQAAYLAQIAHESGGFRWMKEMWGPTDAQLRYEPPGELASKLGNTQPGDGKRYMGRGPIQITGRFNYKAMGAKLGMDLERFPELLDEPQAACRSSGAFWDGKGLNAYADSGDFIGLTRRINGGTNGLAERQALWAKAKTELGL